MVTTGLYCLAISVASMPPNDKPTRAKGSSRFMAAARRNAYEASVSSFCGVIQSRCTASQSGGNDIYLNTRLSAASPLIKYTFIIGSPMQIYFPYYGFEVKKSSKYRPAQKTYLWGQQTT